ncbi:MAG: hypothetical protein ACREMA_20945, partial [Longimicrobiales bacterium]
SPNPAGSPDAEIAITSTPAYVRSQLPGTVSSAYVVPALAFAVGDGITKTCYVEFVPTGGTTSGKIPFEVVTPVLSVGNPNTHLDPRIRVGIAGGGPSSVGTSTGQGTHGPPLGGVASNAMNQSGNLFMRGQHPIAWERGFSSVGAEIGFYSGVQGAVLSFSATVVPNTADTVWSARVIFKDIDGVTLATVTGFTTFRIPPTPPGGWPPDQLPPAQGPIYLHNVTPPAGSVVVWMEPVQISGPPSGAFFRHPVCTTGALAQTPSPVPVPSAQHVAESGAAAAANATTTIAEWMARSGAQVGPPPSAIATQPIYDSFGMQVLVDTAERRITHVIAIND